MILTNPPFLHSPSTEESLHLLLDVSCVPYAVLFSTVCWFVCSACGRAACAVVAKKAEYAGHDLRVISSACECAENAGRLFRR